MNRKRILGYALRPLPRKLARDDFAYLKAYVDAAIDDIVTAELLPTRIDDPFSRRETRFSRRRMQTMHSTASHLAAFARRPLRSVTRAMRGTGSIDVAALWQMGEVLRTCGARWSSGLLLLTSVPASRGHALSVARIAVRELLAPVVRCVALGVPAQRRYDWLVWPSISYVLTHTDVALHAAVKLADKASCGSYWYFPDSWLAATGRARTANRELLLRMGHPIFARILNDAWTEHRYHEVTMEEVSDKTNDAPDANDDSVVWSEVGCILAPITNAILRERLGSPVEDRAYAQRQIESLIAEVDSLLA